MIITKTPFRMSFFGGGTDMEEYFKENEGAVLSTTFDKYCYINVRHLPRFFDYSTELSYSKTERVTDVNDIQHPAIREAMKMLDMHEIRLTYEADLPARSGLGTSSSFAVGMLNAFYALKGKYADKKRLSDEAIYLERVLCKEVGGCVFGDFNIRKQQKYNECCCCRKGPWNKSSRSYRKRRGRTCKNGRCYYSCSGNRNIHDSGTAFAGISLLVFNA